MNKSLKEDERIKKMVQSNPKKFVDEYLATSGSHWIWHQIDNYFGQYCAEEGFLLVRCHCVMCHHNGCGMKRARNTHCVNCQCRECVCEAREKKGYHNEEKSFCGGKCKNCE